jgi:hypothetical protein
MNEIKKRLGMFLDEILRGIQILRNEKYVVADVVWPGSLLHCIFADFFFWPNSLCSGLFFALPSTFFLSREIGHFFVEIERLPHKFTVLFGCSMLF